MSVSVVACALFFVQSYITSKKILYMETGTAHQKITLSFINDKSPILDCICNDLIASGFKVLFRSENIEEGLLQLSLFTELPQTSNIDHVFFFIIKLA